MTDGALMTSTEAGVLLRKSGRTVQRMAENGELPYVRKLPGSNGAYLFEAAVIKRVAAELTQEQVST
jgi:excisionase family DNA binding protein